MDSLISPEVQEWVEYVVKTSVNPQYACRAVLVAAFGNPGIDPRMQYQTDPEFYARVNLAANTLEALFDRRIREELTDRGAHNL